MQEQSFQGQDLSGADFSKADIRGTNLTRIEAGEDTRQSCISNLLSQPMQTITDIGTLIVKTPGTCGGRPRIAGHRLTVHNIAIDFNAGMKPEDILEQRPQLSLAKIYAALTYYFANKAVVDAEIAADQEEYAHLEAECRTKMP